RRLDELGRRHLDRMQLAVQLAAPEIEEPAQDREVGGQIEILPDIALQEARIVGHVVEDLRGRQTIILELLPEIAFHIHPSVPGRTVTGLAWHRSFVVDSSVSGKKSMNNNSLAASPPALLPDAW